MFRYIIIIIYEVLTVKSLYDAYTGVLTPPTYQQ